MTGGASPTDLHAVEAALGLPLSVEHRALLSTENGGEHWYGDVFLMIYGTDSLVDVDREIERHPGFLAFASDGSREIIGYDTRVAPSPVVMIDITSAGWDDALYQAASLNEFMRQRLSGEDFRWDQPYRPRT